jgi:anti-anti-sigma factor
MNSWLELLHKLVERWYAGLRATGSSGCAAFVPGERWHSDELYSSEGVSSWVEGAEGMRCDDVVIVQPRGDLDRPTAERLRPALNGIAHAGRILRGLSFMASTGLHLLPALQQRSQHDGFQLALVNRRNGRRPTDVPWPDAPAAQHGT